MTRVTSAELIEPNLSSVTKSKIKQKLIANQVKSIKMLYLSTLLLKINRSFINEKMKGFMPTHTCHF